MASHNQHSDEQHKEHEALTPWILGGIGVVSAITLAPYLLPFLGLGTPINAPHGHAAMSLIGQPATAGALGSGWAGGLQTALSQVPVIGSALTSTETVNMMGASITAGALTTAISAGVIGIGGMLLANWLEKRETGHEKIRWSKIVRYASLATSMLISLPSLLTGLSLGITFIAELFGANQLQMITTMRDSLGGVAMQHGASAGNVGGLIALVPHLFSCGVAALPILGTLLVGQKSKPSPTPQVSTFAQHLPDGSRALSIALRDQQTGAALTPHAIETTHTRKLHTMVVNQSLTDYHHLHPEYNPNTEQWETTFTPRTHEAYHAWNEFTLRGDTAPTQHKTDVPSDAQLRSIEPVIAHQNHAKAGDVIIHCNGNSPLRAGTENTWSIDLRDAHGKPITYFHPIMGADAHLVGFSKDGTSMIHCHPIARHDNIVQFHIAPKHEGFTKFFLQIHPENGDLTTIPFGQYIAPAQHYTQRTKQAPHHHAAVAFA
ncbi:MAG: hypothetical protein J0M34_08205 [Alphaproteobacteria bacterium]|nr:hypothetical protein [Alphaproteobacteria bacterium]